MRGTNTGERYPGSHEPFLSCSSSCDRYLEKSCGWLLELLPQPPKAVSMAIHPICLFSLFLSLFHCLSSRSPFPLLYACYLTCCCPFSCEYLLSQSCPLIPHFYSGCTYARLLESSRVFCLSNPIHLYSAIRFACTGHAICRILVWKKTWVNMHIKVIKPASRSDFHWFLLGTMCG